MREDTNMPLEEKGKMSGAMRIFHALSSVDEELLARSEEERKVIPLWRYTKVMAACACFVMLGVVVWTGTKLIDTKDNMSSDCAAPEAPAEMVQMTNDVNAEGACEEAVAEEKAQGSQSENAEYESVKDADGIIYDEVAQAPVLEMLSEEKLRAIDVVGAYLPTQLPEGYVFADGNGYVEEDLKSVSVTWQNGMDDISITVVECIEEDELERRLVDVSKPECYDVHLYEIPYASSVPDDIRDTFNNPIFKESDFDVNIVRARMKSVKEAGDTDTLRGNFAVLYDSGVLVYFSGHGDAESIWNMFQSIEMKKGSSN